MGRNDRALAMGTVVFFATIAVAALLYIILEPAASQIFTTASGVGSNAEAQGVIDEREQIWGLVLLYGLFLAGVGIIARAVRESRRGF